MVPSDPGPSPVPPPEDLTARLHALEARVADLEARLEAAPAVRRPQTAAVAAGPTVAGVAAGAAGASISALALAGRLCLVFAGAYLVRSFTDAGTFPKALGALLGMAYAGIWAVAADRAGARGRSSLATALAVSAALIAYPLVWEATVGFKVLGPGGAAAALGGVATVLVAVAWRQDLQAAAWVAALGALATGFGLMTVTAALDAFTLLFLVLGAGLLWLTYGRRWHDLRWPAALAADLGVLLTALLVTWPGGAPEAYRGLAPGRALALALLLVAVYLGSFIFRILMRHREPSLFEGVQGALALVAGLGGAVRIAQHSGSGEFGLGLAGALGGLACYGAAFAFVERQEEGGRSFTYFTSLALVLVAAGILVLIGGDGRTWAFVGLGLGSTLAGLRHGRWTLLAHGAVYFTGAALASQLIARGLEAFLAPAGQARTPATAPLLVTLAAVTLAHLLLSRGPGGRTWARRLPSFAAGLWAALGLGALLVAGLAALLPAEPSVLAAARTAVLAGSAAALAALSRLRPASELRWLVYPLLGLAGVKLVLQDLALGRPLTLFPALAVFGAALILAPRLLRGTAAESEP